MNGMEDWVLYRRRAAKINDEDKMEEADTHEKPKADDETKPPNGQRTEASAGYQKQAKRP